MKNHLDIAKIEKLKKLKTKALEDKKTIKK